MSLAIVLDHHENYSKVLFRCDCGRNVIIPIKRIRQGKYRDACSRCWRPPKRSRGRPPNPWKQKHPDLYPIWQNLKKQKKLCYAWKRHFSSFCKAVAPKPEGSHIRRMNKDKPYGPGNWFWAYPHTEYYSEGKNLG